MTVLEIKYPFVVGGLIDECADFDDKCPFLIPYEMTEAFAHLYWHEFKWNVFLVIKRYSLLKILTMNEHLINVMVESSFRS